MDLSEFQGFWTPTRKCFRNLGLDLDEIRALQQSDLKSLLAEELEFVAVLLKSGLYIENNTFKIRFANPKSGKLKTIRKGLFVEQSLDKKERTVLHFIDNEGDNGRFIYKKDKLVDPDSPFRFKPASSD